MNNQDQLQILRNVVAIMPKVYRNRNSNLKIVKDVLMIGTYYSGRTSCLEKCMELGIDPDSFILPEKAK